MSTDSESQSTRPTTAISESVTGAEAVKPKEEESEKVEKVENAKSDAGSVTPTASTSASSVPPKREPSLVVIACRQWYVLSTRS
jgi:hypothetical protein